MDITSAKIKKNNSLKVSFKRNGANVDEDHPEVADAELLIKFNALCIHFGLMGYFIRHELVPDIRGYDGKLIEDITIHGFTIGGPDDGRGIQLFGHVLLPNKKAMNVTLPFYKFDDESPNSYEFMEELIEDLEALQDEIILYLGGKHAPAVTKAPVDKSQTKIDFPEGDDDPITKAQVAEPVKSDKLSVETADDIGMRHVGKGPMAVKIPQADPEAMKRVADGDAQLPKKSGRKKKG